MKIDDKRGQVLFNRKYFLKVSNLFSTSQLLSNNITFQQLVPLYTIGSKLYSKSCFYSKGEEKKVLQFGHIFFKLKMPTFLSKDNIRTTPFSQK